MMAKFCKKRLANFFLSFFVVSMLLPSFVSANTQFSVSPKIIDEVAKPREILKNSVVLTNNTNHNVKIYAFVNNIDMQNGEQDYLSRSEVQIGDSLANWIEITRALIRLDPGETREIPYLIHINLHAKPGKYHARIAFASGHNQSEAEKTIVADTSIAVNIEVPDDSKERLQLASFSSDETFFSDGIASFTYFLENIGNRSLAPRGEVRIYNRKGEEVASIKANEGGASLMPEATSQLSAVWNADGEFGRYKAFLDLSYGDKQYGTVQDTVYFWIVPWKKIFAIFIILSIIVGGVTLYLHRKYEDRRGFSPQLVPSTPTQMPQRETATRTTNNEQINLTLNRAPARVIASSQQALNLGRKVPTQTPGHTIDLKRK